MAKCEKCGMNIPDDAEVCPYCGTKTSYGHANNISVTLFSYGIIICLILYALKSCFS